MNHFIAGTSTSSMTHKTGHLMSTKYMYTNKIVVDCACKEVKSESGYSPCRYKDL